MRLDFGCDYAKKPMSSTSAQVAPEAKLENRNSSRQGTIRSQNQGSDGALENWRTSTADDQQQQAAAPSEQSNQGFAARDHRGTPRSTLKVTVSIVPMLFILSQAGQRGEIQVRSTEDRSNSDMHLFVYRFASQPAKSGTSPKLDSNDSDMFSSPDSYFRGGV